MTRSFVIGIIGAESTGKTLLVEVLQARLAAAGHDAVGVHEALREFCEREGRTPRADEQAGIAAEQSRRIEAAARRHAFVVADTTALMIAVYSHFVFGDASLYADAERDHRRCDLTILTALDLAWQADGLQRDGAHVREPVDALIRGALHRSATPYAVVSGSGACRSQSAWRGVRHVLGLRGNDSEAEPEPRPETGPGTWHLRCERCGDPDCERRLLVPAPLRA